MNYLLQVGLDGNGKVTCASLACCLSTCNLFKLTISRNYSYVNFKEDLKKVFKQAGLEGKRTVLLITDSDLIQVSYLLHILRLEHFHYSLYFFSLHPGDNRTVDKYQNHILN